MTRCPQINTLPVDGLSDCWIPRHQAAATPLPFLWPLSQLQSQKVSELARNTGKGPAPKQRRTKGTQSIGDADTTKLCPGRHYHLHIRSLKTILHCRRTSQLECSAPEQEKSTNAQDSLIQHGNCARGTVTVSLPNPPHQAPPVDRRRWGGEVGAGRGERRREK